MAIAEAKIYDETPAGMFRTFLRYGTEIFSDEAQRQLRLRVTRETRAQAVGTFSAGGYLAPEDFGSRVLTMLKGFDPLFDPTVTSVVEAGRGTAQPGRWWTIPARLLQSSAKTRPARLWTSRSARSRFLRLAPGGLRL
jgi:hypothetical protein